MRRPSPTNDPTGFIRDHTGAMLPFGRHKGSGLAVMCEIMAGAIGGGQRVDEPTRGGILNSMLATVIDLSRLGDPAAIARNVEATKSHIRSSRVAPGFDEVLLPGEPERRAAAAACRIGDRGGCDDLARHPGGRGRSWASPRSRSTGWRPDKIDTIRRIRAGGTPRRSELTCRCSWLRHQGRLAGAEQRQIGSGRQLIEIRHGDAEEPNALGSQQRSRA